MALIQKKSLGLVLAVGGWFLIFGLTLYPMPKQIENASATNIWCLVCGEIGVVDVLLNVVLFLPLGSGLNLLGLSRFRALLTIGLTTLTVEALQLGLIVGRYASLSDLLTNCAGGAIGYVVAPHWRQIVRTPSRTSFLLAVVGAVGWLMIQAFTAWALERSLPKGIYYGQWAPVLGQFEHFTGEVLAAQVGGIRLPGTRLSDSRLVREALLAPTVVLEVRALSGLPTVDIAPIFSIFDAGQREIVLLGQNGRDLVFHIRTRTGPLKLRSPSVHLSNALPGRAGSSLVLQARYTPGHYHLRSEVDGRISERDLKVSSSWGWTTVFPFDHAFGTEMIWLTMLWVGGLLFPVGYWAGRSYAIGVPAASIVLLLLLGLGLVVIPVLFQMTPGHFTEWAAGLLGGGVGWKLGEREGVRGIGVTH
ncbi:MAG: VanZ family protein [Gammaproteobacteria bacterium]